MTGHLCLKWNNHASAFVHSLSVIQTKEKYCDATIICQGQYFSVHRVVLSTCSEYFEDMFERIQCQHPYIVFKDIEPSEMELLLNYMYQGEVNVIQDSLPNLIKAAEALKIKGLAVPDDIPSGKDSSSRKRANPNSDSSVPKRKTEERKRKASSPTVSHDKSEQQQTNTTSLQDIMFDNLEKPIKQEPEEFADFVTDKIPQPSRESEPSFSKEENEFVKVSSMDLKNESHLSQSQSDVPASSTNDFEDQSLNWSEFSNCNEEDISSEIPDQDAVISSQFLPDICKDNQNMEDGSLTESLEAQISRSNDVYLQITQKLVKTMQEYQCSYCPYKDHLKVNVRRHTMLSHTKKKPFTCDICSYTCVVRRDLDLHMRTHTGEKPFECPRCFVRFRQQCHLKAHLLKKVQCNP